MIYILVPTFARINETKRFLLSLNKSINQDYLAIIVDDHPEKITLKNIKQSSIENFDLVINTKVV